MARWAAGLAALLLLTAPAAGQAQDAFKHGLDAYLNGEYAKALELWRPAAEQGDEVSAFNVGVLYARGLGVEADPSEALKWYRRSAQAGYANAQFNLGAAYFNGDGTQADVAQAVSWWKKAAEQEHPEALYNLATLYRDGRYVQRDVEHAVSLFKRAAAVGDARAEQALARLGSGASGEKPGSQAATTGRETSLDTAAVSGEQASAPRSGEGWPASENPEHWTVQVFAVTKREAAERFVKDHGLVGQVRVFKAEVNGQTWYKGVAGSYAHASEAKAAQKKLEAQLGGASLWIRPFRAVNEEAVGEAPVAGAAGPDDARTGTRTPETSTTTSGDAGSSDGKRPGESAAAEREPVLKATEGGNGARNDDAEQQNDTTAREPKASEAASGQALSTDRGAALRKGQRAFNAQQYKEAFAAWRPLAGQGVADAQYGIGFMYESGWGVAKDYAEAFHWYQLAAQQGHVKSQFNLGMLYREGKGVAQNDALGLYWIQSAADRGDERALSYLKNID